MYTTRARHVRVWKRARSSPIFGLPKLSLFYCLSIKVPVFSLSMLSFTTSVLCWNSLGGVESELEVVDCTGWWEGWTNESPSWAAEDSCVLPWLCRLLVQRPWRGSKWKCTGNVKKAIWEKRGSFPFHLPIIPVCFSYPKSLPPHL